MPRRGALEETAPQPSSPLRRAKVAKMSREDRIAATREAIFRAAAEVVGDLGYVDTRVHHITDRAGIAHGTFYLYFENRQDLFDQLLPYIGQDMVTFIRDRVHGLKDYFSVEEAGFRAFFEFCHQNPGFIRVLNEAESVAPVAHREHFKNLVQQYTASLQRSIASGEIKRMTAGDIEALAYALMGARSYLFLGFIKYGDTGSTKLPESVVQTYLKLVRHGVS
jgi:AcrR family transcriptional regulator